MVDVGEVALALLQHAALVRHHDRELADRPDDVSFRPRLWRSAPRSRPRSDILERGPEGLYRYLVSDEDLRQALFDYLACDRVAAAWAMKRPAKDKDLERKQQAEWRWLR